MNTLNQDKLIGVIFFVLTLFLVLLFMTYPPFFDWAFERHHNPCSWYIRPLFLIPFCYSAYQQSFAGMMFSIFALLTSMFWFPRPNEINDNVATFLQFEQDYLQGHWNVAKIAMTLTIPLAFTLLGIAFWKRSLGLGLVLIVTIAIGKIIWSIYHTGEAGKTILLPAILGLLVCCGVLLFVLKPRNKNNKY